MSADIKVGDLVMIVRDGPCGCPTPQLGRPFTVAVLKTVDLQCNLCGEWTGPVAAARDAERILGGPISMLIKINPPPREDEQPAPPVELPEGVLA